MITITRNHGFLAAPSSGGCFYVDFLLAVTARAV